MIQNSCPATTDILESDASSRQHPGNSYANIDPATLNSAPVPPAGIPTNYVNARHPTMGKIKIIPRMKSNVKIIKVMLRMKSKVKATRNTWKQI